MAKKKPNLTLADAVKTRARRAAPKPEVSKKRVEEKTTSRTITKRPKPKPTVEPYNAERSFGIIPGLAERMKEYMRTMRDEH